MRTTLRMVHARDDLVLLQEPIEQAPAAGIGNVPEHLERDSLAVLLGLCEVHGRQIAGIQLGDEPPLPRPVQRLVIHEQLAGRIQALDAQLAAHDADEPLMLHAILGKEVRRAGLQRVHGEEFVAVCREQQHRRAIVPLAQAAAGSRGPRVTTRGDRAARGRRR